MAWLGREVQLYFIYHPFCHHLSLSCALLETVGTPGAIYSELFYMDRRGCCLCIDGVASIFTGRKEYAKNFDEAKEKVIDSRDNIPGRAGRLHDKAIVRKV